MKIKKALTFLGWPLLAAPHALSFLGIMMNEAVIWANGLKMPARFAGCTDDVLGPGAINHQCLNSATHLKLLADIFISNAGVSSIGDLLQSYGDIILHTAIYVWIALLLYCAWTKTKPYLE